MPWKPWHTALAVAAGVAGAILLARHLRTRSSSLSAPIMENEEIWEVKSDEHGNPQRIVIHRKVTGSPQPGIQSEDSRVLQFVDGRLATKLGKIEEGVSKLPSERTYVVNPICPITIRGVYEVCSVYGSGKMHEFLVISPNTQFSLYIKVDDRPPIYDYTYANLAQITDDVDEITAYQDANTGNFIIHIGELKFAKSLIVRIHGIGTAGRIFLKYTLSPPDERNRKS